VRTWSIEPDPKGDAQSRILSGAIDQLTYTYQTNSNKLSQVTDGANDPNSQLGDFHYKGTKGAYDYSYDGNGNLVQDNNKSIDKIVYNYMNLPQQVHMNGEGNIFYTYDAAGTKLQKQTIDSLGGVATTTLYLDGFQYQRRTPIATPSSGVDTLQFMGTEEGRARWAFHKYLNGTTTNGWEYDFMERDHLGNTRVILTQEKDSAQYLASMEAAYRSTENALFYNIPATSYARNSVSGYPVDLTFTNPNDSVARTNGSGPKEGPAIILKVMAGDKVDLGVQYYYNSMTNTNGPNLSTSDLLNSLASGLVAITGTTHGTFSTLDNTTTSPLLGALTSSIGNETGTGTSKPQAYLNWVLLDNQFNYVSGSSGALQVAAAGTQANGSLQPPLAMTGIPMTKSGFLYIYVSNATPGWDVFFDNLSVKTYAGPMLEEDHYYPFGLAMAGISDKAIKTNYAENKYRFTGQLYDDDLGWDAYQMKYRTMDPQLGRFWQIDPLATKYEYNSAYAYAEDKVTVGKDLEGAELWRVVGDFLGNNMNDLPNAVAGLFAETDGAMQATTRLSNGTSGQQDSHLPSQVQGINSAIDKANDVVAAAQPAVDIAQTSLELWSSLPIGEAGLPVAANELVTQSFSTATFEPINIAESFTLKSTPAEIPLQTPSLNSPNFIVDQSGTAFPVPSGAKGPTPVINPAGKQTGVAFTGGSGGANGKVTTMRIMNPTPARGSSPGYPNGYVKYENASKQGVHPYSGKTVPNTESHHPIKPTNGD